MSGWMLAGIYFCAGLIGVFLCAGVRRSGLAFVAGALLLGAAYGLRWLGGGSLFGGWGEIAGGCLAMAGAGMLLQLLLRWKNRRSGRRAARARQANGRPGRMRAAERRRRVLRTVLLVPLCLALCTGGVMLYTSLGAGGGSGVLDGSLATPAALRRKSLNILVCGIDNDQNDEAHRQNMTDVIMLVNIDLENKTAAILQIPRDTYIGDVTATGKINAVYNNFETDGARINALAGQLNRMFALPVDNYVTITMEGFRKAVDAIGGVEVNLESEMVFNLRDPNEVIVRTITLPAGKNLLDGELADLFVRYRDYVRADLDRMNVQRVFLAALMNQLTSLPVGELLGAVKAVYPYLGTDFSLAQLAGLALKARSFSPDSILALRAPGEPTMTGGQSVFTLHRQALADMLNASMRPHMDAVPAQQLDVIELQNTTDLLDRSQGTLDGYQPGG